MTTLNGLRIILDTPLEIGGELRHPGLTLLEGLCPAEITVAEVGRILTERLEDGRAPFHIVPDVEDDENENPELGGVLVP